MRNLFTVAFWRDATERAIKTAAQSAILGLGLGEGLNLFDVDPMLMLGFAGGGALLSLLTSIASAPIGQKGSASLARIP